MVVVWLHVGFYNCSFCYYQFCSSHQTKRLCCTENDPPREGRCLNLTCLFGLPIIFRYAEEFKQWNSAYCKNLPCSRKNCGDIVTVTVKIASRIMSRSKRKLAKSAYKLAWLRHIETVTESIPQWCLQVYIMLRQWYFPWYTLVSIVVSLLSSAWNNCFLCLCVEILRAWLFSLQRIFF